MQATHTRVEAVSAFRALHHNNQPLLLPNAWDYSSAAGLAAAGFAAIGTTSLGVAAAHGLPDAEGLARAETVALARRLSRLPCLVTVDVEGGFSRDPGEVASLAEELATSGVVGINLEDGRPGGTLADPDHHAELVRAVKTSVPDLFLNARVDTYWLAGTQSPSPQATIARAERYVAEGADGIFVPGLAEDDDIRAVVAAVPVPVNILYTPRRHRLERLAELGVRRVSTGSLLFRTALHAAITQVKEIRDGGPVVDDVPSYTEIEKLIARP